jgi:hypothetical protein
MPSKKSHKKKLLVSSCMKTNKIDKCQDETYEEKMKAIRRRFPGARFVIHCFAFIDEIETKMITDEDLILCSDRFSLQPLMKRECNDYYIVRKREGQTHIRYCDVIDTLIENNFIRVDCTHFALERIKYYGYRRNTNSVPTYCLEWNFPSTWWASNNPDDIPEAVREIYNQHTK